MVVLTCTLPAAMQASVNATILQSCFGAVGLQHKPMCRLAISAPTSAHSVLLQELLMMLPFKLNIDFRSSHVQAQEEQIMTDFGPEDERLEGIYERMEELDPAKFEVDAAKLLHGLGFDKAMMAKGTKDMSGEWPHIICGDSA